MTVHLQHNWLPVIGEAVEIRLNGQTVRHGIVDNVTNDDSILWLMADHPYHRQMVNRADGYEVWIRYIWEKPTMSISMQA